jgi:multidrug transporter EmrE-like cation transporter
VFGFSWNVIVTFLVIVVCQLIGAGFLPKTEGFTKIGYTLVSLSMFAIASAAMARLIRSGIELGILIPALSATVPMFTIGIGILLYGESASVPRVSMLIVACLLVGLASRY